MEYTYDYQGRLLTGIPELSSAHFSGVGIKCRLSLSVTHTGRIVLRIREAEFAKVNDVRSGIISRPPRPHDEFCFT